MTMGLKREVVIAVTIAVLAAIGVGLLAIYGVPAVPKSGGVSDCGFSTTCSATNPAGFALTLSMNTTSIGPNEFLLFDMQITNPSGHRINITSSRDWVVPSMSQMACNDLNTPFAWAVFKGHYTPDNISSAQNIALNEYNPANFTMRCESISQYASSHNYTYHFFPHGSQMEYQGAVCSSNNTSEFRYPNGDTCEFPLQSDKPATYTLAAGDYWGDLVLVNFSVVSTT